MISASVLLHQGGDFYTPLALTVTPRHREASGHRDQKQGRGHTKTPAQHDAMRTHEKLLHLMYWLISCL